MQTGTAISCCGTEIFSEGSCEMYHSARVSIPHADTVRDMSELTPFVLHLVNYMLEFPRRRG